MKNPIKWLNEYDEKYPCYVEGVKQIGLKSTLFAVFAMFGMMVILHFILN